MSTAKRSSLRLSEVARHVVIPSGIVATGWDEVEARCAEFGDVFDEWQRGLGSVILGIRDDGMYAATIGGVTLSIPRQVAKTFLVGRIVIALYRRYPETTAIWTAHHGGTALDTFGSLRGFADRPEVKPYIVATRASAEARGFDFSNGSRLRFGARESGFGRGFTKVDIEVFDEAQILTQRPLDDMIAATNQTTHPHGALLFYMGTPPRPIDPSEVFELRRRKALEVKGDPDRFGEVDIGADALYVECSADVGCNLDDRKQWARANPSYPHRTPLTSMLRLRENLGNDDSWKREALGIWDEDDAAVDPFANWHGLADEESLPADATLRLSIDVPRELTSASFAIAGLREDGLHHISERLYVGPDRMDKLVELAKALTDGHSTSLIIPPGSPARGWLAEFEQAGVPLDEMKAHEYASACSNIQAKVIDGSLRHRGQDRMNAAVAGLERRTSGDVDVWSRRSSKVNIAPFVAATCALARVPQVINTEFFAGAWR